MSVSKTLRLSFLSVSLLSLLSSCRTSQASELQAAADDAPQSMLRLWRGYGQDRTDYQRFVDLLNSKLIPQTINVNAGKGLIGYLPFILPQTKPEFLPDEIALVAYSSAEDYQAIRSTPEGQAYGALHFDPGLFAKQNAKGIPSGSSVAAIYDSSKPISLDEKTPSAFIFGEQSDWQNKQCLFRVVLPLESEFTVSAVQSALARWNSSVNANRVVSSAIVLTTNRYLLEVVCGSDIKTVASTAEATDRSIGRTFLSRPYLQHSIESAKIGAGQGVNVQFQQ